MQPEQPSPQPQIKNLKYILIAFGVLLIVFLVVIITHRLINSATIDLVATPSSSTIYLDSHKVTNGKIGVTPGKHTITVSKSGFLNQKMDIDAKSGETSQAFFILESNDPSTSNWYNEHIEDQELLEMITGFKNTEQIQQSIQEYPLYAFLPEHTMNYKLDHGSCEFADFCVFVTVPNDTHDPAIHILKGYDNDIGRYYIINSDYKNPFAELDLKATSTAKDINQAITELIPTPKFTIITTKKSDNNYYLLSINYTFNEYNRSDTYKAILQYTNGVWSLITTPDLVITYDKYPNIPKSIIKQVNDL